MNNRQNRHQGIGAAVDLGSTTIAVDLMDLNAREKILSFSFPNPQFCYGADIITRIRHCIEDSEKLATMGRMVRESLWRKLEEHLGQDFKRIEKIVYSGNTTMLHILRGMSVDGLAVAPFHPVSIEYAEIEEVQPIWHTAIYPPGFSAFVGADILTGAEYLSMGKYASYDLLVDLGTNGELLLLNKDCGYAASAACGTVFDHAVSGASYGSECIKAIAGCVKRKLIDENGTLKEPFFEKGIEIDKGFVIKQDHIRNFQLAKGAIYAGIISLMKKAGITKEAIGNVYISGGLGFFMDIRDAITVKMIPKDLAEKITVVGNSSLLGAKELLLTKDEDKSLILSEYEAIRKRTESFEFANFEDFQEIFLSSLNF